MMSYITLQNWLAARGIGSFMQNPGQMVISNKNPPMPGGNCFWVTLKNNDWVIATFLPAAYLVPKDQNIGNLCEAVLGSSATALYRLDESLIKQYNLRELTEDEINSL
jgi:hypothetical protein